MLFTHVPFKEENADLLDILILENSCPTLQVSTPDWSIREQVADDAPVWIIWGRTRRSGHHPQDMINWVKVARRPGQDRLGRIKQEEPPTPGQVRN